MRYSRQRSIIKDIVFSTKLHPNADWVYHKVKKFHSKYKSWELFIEI